MKGVSDIDMMVTIIVLYTQQEKLRCREKKELKEFSCKTTLSSQEGSWTIPMQSHAHNHYYVLNLFTYFKEILHCCLRILVEMEIFMTLIAREIGNRLRNLKMNEELLFTAFPNIIIFRLNKGARKPFQLHK